MPATNALNTVLNERQTTHGSYTDQAVLACTILDVFQSGANWKRLTSAQQYALIMIAGKISRVLTGNPNFPDHWVDVAGYASLVEQTIPKTEGTE